MNNKGFTIFEVILVVAVVAFTTALAFPTAMEMMDNRRINEEKTSLEELDEIFRIYFWENKEIPLGTDIEAFAQETSTTSVLNYNGIIEDAFGNPRFYQSRTASLDFKDSTIETYYGFIYSTGLNGCMGLDNDICSVDDISATLNGWWGAEPEKALQAIEALEGDYIVKFSTQGDSAAAYNKTVERLRRLGAALQEYNKLQGYHALANDETDAMIYFPPSQGVDLDTVYDDSEDDILEELNKNDLFGSVGGGQAVITTDNNDDTDEMERRWSMIALARLIGLPDEFCCHPLDHFEFDGKMYEKAFYYYASPYMNLTEFGGGCQAPSDAENFYPARISVAEDECGNP